jgi:metallo-beta-lactamase family protein
MRITFHGAAQTVTGSQHLIEVNGSKILLDCGLYQGRRAESYLRNRTFQFDPRQLDAVVLSHAHIDHCGNLPNLVKQGFSGPIYATPATADLTDILLLDSGHIQESDAEFMNRRNAGRGNEAIEPLYTQADAARVAPLFHSIAYDQEFEPSPGVIARFVEAGHILGSAAISLVLQEQNRRIRLWFSGDIGRYKLPLLRDPVLPNEADYLLMECTYGDKPHADPSISYEEFREVVAKTVGREGKVIIPAFAVGRTQELVYNLNNMMYHGEVPLVPVYIDSPLAVNASDVFKRHTECLDNETRKFVEESRHPALDFKMLTYIRSVEDSKALNERKDPMIIISASGMAESGRILHHLRNNIGNPKNTVCIVSWQAPNTLGRRLADREPQVKIFGEAFDVRAQVATIRGLSAHAGQDLLAKYALGVKESVRKVFLVHGEAKQAGILTDLLHHRQMQNVHYPEMHTSSEL